MATDGTGNSRDGFSRREFLYRVGAGVPTLSVAVGSAAAPRPARGPEPAAASDKFTPIDLSSHFNVSPRDFGPRDRAKAFLGGEAEKDGLVRTLGGNRRLQGAPFRLGPEDADQKSWVGLSTQAHPWATPAIEVELNRKAHYVCFASFCDWDPNETPRRNRTL